MRRKIRKFKVQDFNRYSIMLFIIRIFALGLASSQVSATRPQIDSEMPVVSKGKLDFV